MRQNLLSEGKTGKPALPAGRYLKYAIGEIILVVNGILIALHKIKETKEELEYSLESSQVLIKQIDDYLKENYN